MLVLFLVKVPSKEVAHAVFHDSLLYLRKVINVHSEVLDQLSGFLDIVICAQGLDQLHFHVLIILN
jgi:hypothetical protein